MEELSRYIFIYSWRAITRRSKSGSRKFLLNFLNNCLKSKNLTNWWIFLKIWRYSVHSFISHKMVNHHIFHGLVWSCIGTISTYILNEVYQLIILTRRALSSPQINVSAKYKPFQNESCTLWLIYFTLWSWWCVALYL